MRSFRALSFVAVLALVVAFVAPSGGFVTGSLVPMSHFSESQNGARTPTPSSNWAGYAALNTSGHTNGAVTKSAGTWTQPTVSCSSGRTTDVSTWVGIDGYSSGTVEQTGTSGDCSGHSVSYYAWYELYPAYSVTISSITVHAGDKIIASVTYSTSTGKFTMTIADGSHSFTKVGTASGAQRSSAECIVERDSVGGLLNQLSKFTSDKFSSCTATINGATGGIGIFAQVFQITMKGTKILATTSSLTSHTSFHCTWKGYR